MKELLFGAAYYDEYMPCDRLAQDVEMMKKVGIHVIIGTPTYAVPSWMVKDHPDVLVTTAKGRALYGSRQIMDITHSAYLFYAEIAFGGDMTRSLKQDNYLVIETQAQGWPGKR